MILVDGCFWQCGNRKEDMCREFVVFLCAMSQVRGGEVVFIEYLAVHNTSLGEENIEWQHCFIETSTLNVLPHDIN